MLSNRKPVVLLAGAAAGVMLLTSAAFACTTYKGKAMVTAGAGTSTAWGANSGMTHCSSASGYAPTSVATVDNVTGGTITVQTLKTTAGVDGCSTSQLAASKATMPGKRIYYVTYLNRNGFVSSGGVWTWSVDCMYNRNGSLVLNAADGGTQEIKIDANGSTLNAAGTAAGTRNYTIPINQVDNTTDRAGVCIGDTGGAQGNQVPLQII